MAIIYNSDLTKEIVKGAGVQISRDRTPSEIAEKVVPVMEVNPKLLRTCNIVESATSGATGSTTVYTTPATQDFFLTACTLNFRDGATSDSVGAYMTIVVNGATKRIIQFSKLSLDATSMYTSLSLPVPIKVDRNTNIVITNAFTVGSSQKAGTIIGYTVDSSLGG